MSRANGHRADVLREEIRQTRAELGATMQALATKADVPARMRASAAHTTARVRRVGYSPAPWLVLAGAAAVVLFVLAARGRHR